MNHSNSPLLTTRQACPCCNEPANRQNVIAVTPKIPAYQGCLDSLSAHDDYAFPQTWLRCDSCGIAYLAELVSPDIVYMGSHATSLGAIWDEHHREFAQFVGQHAKGHILEVGGGVGKLATSFRAQGYNNPWVILEANILPPETEVADLSFEQGILSPDYPLNQNNTLVFSHCLEHIPDLGQMVATIANALPDDGRHIVSWPQIEAWLPQSLPGALNWEHTYYVPIDTLIALHARAGLALQEHKIFKDHSHFLAFKKTSTAQAPVPFLASKAEENAQAVANYWRGFEAKITKLNKILSAHPQPYYLMPASVYSQFILSFAGDSLKVTALLDDAPLKQGKRLYGFPYRVVPTPAIRETGGTVILNGGSHTLRILEALHKINPEISVINLLDL